MYNICMCTHLYIIRDRDRSAPSPSRYTRPQRQMVNPNARNPECGCLKPHGVETCGFSLINKFALRSSMVILLFFPTGNVFYVRFEYPIVAQQYSILPTTMLYVLYITSKEVQLVYNQNRIP